MTLTAMFYKDLKNVLKSRTIMTLIVLLAVNLLDRFSNILDPNLVVALNVILSTMIGYFRINTKQKYGKNT